MFCRNHPVYPAGDWWRGPCSAWGGVWLSQLGVDCGHEVSRRVGLEPGVALEVNLDGVPHCLADVGDGHVGGVHLLGVAMAKGISRELFT